MKRSLKKILTLTCCVLIPFLSIAKSNLTGGGSDGGGNSYRGKPLESYAKNPATLAAFQKQIQPLLKDLESKRSSDNTLHILKNMISSVFEQKVWYFVPGPLEHIPSDLLNSAIRTDQAALQGFDRVWIDEDIWNSMSTDDQAKLLLHEVYMGLKILQFASTFRLCEAAWGTAYNCSQKERMDAVIALTSKDYVNVQNMTIQTSSNFPTMTADDWMQLIQQSNLRYHYDWFDKKSKVTPSLLSQLLTRSTVSGFLPNQGYNMRKLDTSELPPMNSQKDYYEYLQKNKEICQVQAQVTGNSLHLKISSKSEGFEQIITLPSAIESRYDDIFHEKRNLQIISLGHYTLHERLTGGYTFYNISFGFDSYRLAQVYVQELVCMDIDCSTPYVDVKGGMNYMCSDNGKLFKL